MRASARLKRLERLRPKSPYGIRQVFLTVPRSSFGNSGVPCSDHTDCRVANFGPVDAHFRLEQPLPGSVS